MAQVLIDSGPITATHRLWEVPKAQWRDLMRKRETYLAIQLSHDCRCLVEFCNDAIEMHDECGFASPEEMIRDGYGLVPEEVAIAVEWLKLNPPIEPVSLQAAIVLGKQGRPWKHEQSNKGDNITFKDRGTSRAYILARLERDGLHELARRVRAGDLSANAAAIEAGYRKKPTPFEQVMKLLPKLTTAELNELCEKHCAD